MKNRLKLCLLIMVGALIAIRAAVPLQAQIVNQIRANIEHPFVIGEKTLPPGEYIFRMDPNAGLSTMTVQSPKGDNLAQFEVRQTTANHMPSHSELVFRKFGDTEFLSKIFERGVRSGVELTETSKREQHLVSQGQHFMEHTEEQR